MDPLSLAVGAFLVIVAGAAALRIGLALSDRQALQHRIINRELGQDLAGERRRTGAVRDAVSRLAVDPRTPPHVRLYLEDHVAPLLVDRYQSGSRVARPPAPSWWRRLVGWLAGALRRMRR